MKTIIHLLNQFLPLLLIMLWVYAALSKLFDFNEFKWQMHNQVFAPLIADVLIWGLPPVELMTATLLIFEVTKKAGLAISGWLMFAFTCYVGLVNFHYFSEIPCSCGGILQEMSWSVHFYFNLLILSLIILSTVFSQRKEVTGKR